MLKILFLFMALGLLNCSSPLYSSADLQGAETFNERGTYEPFPEPIGDKMLPVGENPWYRYRFSEIDDDGSVVETIRDLQLNIYNFRLNEFKFEFEASGSGLVLTFIDSRGDYNGIYIIGTYQDTVTSYGDTVLWFPQTPHKIDPWDFGMGSTMELINRDTTYLTENLLNENVISMPGEVSFEEHRAHLFKETQQDTSIYWYVRRGVGILGFEKVINNKTVEVATLHSLKQNFVLIDPLVYR